MQGLATAPSRDQEEEEEDQASHLRHRCNMHQQEKSCEVDATRRTPCLKMMQGPATASRNQEEEERPIELFPTRVSYATAGDLVVPVGVHS